MMTTTDLSVQLFALSGVGLTWWRHEYQVRRQRSQVVWSETSDVPLQTGGAGVVVSVDLIADCVDINSSNHTHLCVSNITDNITSTVHASHTREQLQNPQLCHHFQ